MSKQDENFILDMLAGGDTIRRIDGRHTYGFVNLEALEKLIQEGRVSVTQLAGLDFVVKKEADHETPA